MLGAPDATILRNMNTMLHHRGPDGQEVWANETLGLGHSRLAIVDLKTGDQPMHSPYLDTLIMNGEIYNHRELRRAHSSYPFKSQSDSEVVLALLDSVRRSQHVPTANDFAMAFSTLEGMYAIALWDEINQTLILARDPLGIKPLAITHVAGSMLFSSEIKAFNAHPEYTPSIDELALAARLAYEYPLDGTTLLSGVRQLRAGCVEAWKFIDNKPTLCSSATIERYTLQPKDGWKAEVDAQHLLDSFIQSVEHRLMADVPVGIVLSGGLDSSLVAAVANQAAEHANQPVPECWTVAENEENPDWIAAEQVASQFDLVHHQHILDEQVFDCTLPSLIWHGEDLDVTVAFFQPLFKTMAQRVKVGLCGQGADELHAGYPRYKQLRYHKQTILQRLHHLPPHLSNPILHGPLPDQQGWYSNEHDPNTHFNSLNSTLQFELNHGQLTNFQLRLVDRHSMAHSLEVRVPFLGKNHRKQASYLPDEWRLPPSGLEKRALRAAADLTGLPKSIVNRPKLPAGRATAPSTLEAFMKNYHAQAMELTTHYSHYTKVFDGQPELALGLGLFEASHILQPHRIGKNTIDGMLSEVL